MASVEKLALHLLKKDSKTVRDFDLIKDEDPIIVSVP